MTTLQKIRFCVAVMIVGLVFSGLTAIPLETELGWMAGWLGVDLNGAAPEAGLGHWIYRVATGLKEMNVKHPFLAYGFDWLAFGHVVIAIAFIGAWRDPVRNVWLFEFGKIACVLVIPWALVFGEVRGIPLYWRLIDCSFGVIGYVPMWLCGKWVREMTNNETRMTKE